MGVDNSHKKIFEYFDRMATIEVPSNIQLDNNGKNFVMDDKKHTELMQKNMKKDDESLAELAMSAYGKEELNDEQSERSNKEQD